MNSNSRKPYNPKPVRQIMGVVAYGYGWLTSWIKERDLIEVSKLDCFKLGVEFEAFARELNGGMDFEMHVNIHNATRIKKLVQEKSNGVIELGKAQLGVVRTKVSFR